MRRRPVTLILLVLLVAPRALSAQGGAPQQTRKLSSLDLLETARTLFLQGDYEKAREYYLQVLPSYPRNFEALKNLAYCYFLMGPHGYAQAAQYYARAQEINPRSVEVDEYLSKCYLALKRYDEAAAIYRQLAALPNSPPNTLRRVAEAYELAGRIPEAEAAYLNCLQQNPRDLTARVGLGRIFSWENKYANALDQFHAVLSAHPDSSPALIGTARVLTWENKFAEGLQLYDRVLTSEPRNGEALGGKAFTLLWMGRPKESQAIFAELRQRYPEDIEIARGLESANAAIRATAADAGRGSQEVAQTVGYYRQRLEKDPKDFVALKTLAELMVTPMHCAEAIDLARQAMALSPGDTSLELTLGRSQASCRRYEEAIATYRNFLHSHPRAENPLFELGDTLLRARQPEEAEKTFRTLLQLDPTRLDATLGLARALAATGNYTEAMLDYDEALKISPDDYDALQGKAYLLYYTRQYAQARLIFTRLAEKQPNDPENTEALESIDRAEEEARWAALRPLPNAGTKAWLNYYQKRLASYPDAVDTKMELARLLGVDHQYDASIKLYQEILKTTPDDPEAMESLARVYASSGRVRDAIQVYQALSAKDPSNSRYPLQIARLQLRSKGYPAARGVLVSLLSTNPQNLEARLELAQLDLAQHRWDDSLKNFDAVLQQNPSDPDALLGKAQISYYQGKMPQAQATASALVEEHPDNYDAVFLLASIEHARGHRRAALNLLDQADRLAPHNPEVMEMKKRVAEEARVAVHTSASFAREIGPPTEAVTQTGRERTGLPNEDLRMYSYGTRIELSVIPRTESSLSLTSLPTDSPPGPLRDNQGNQIPTGITGATGAAEFFYQQTTQVWSLLTLRGGVGLARFGPGGLENLPGQPRPVSSGKIRPLGLAGFSIAPTKKFSFDVNVARSPVIYTPVSVKFGLIEDRISSGLNFFFTPRTELHLEGYYVRYSTHDIGQCFATDQKTVEGSACHDQGHGGSAIFNRNLIRSDHFSFDAGYKGQAFGFAGPRRKLFLGFFNPSFYQNHLLTTRLYGKLAGPLGYDFSGGFGVQQVLQGRALTRALIVSPTLTLKVSPHLTLSAGYTHYDTAQALGPLRGNAVQASTDWRF